MPIGQLCRGLAILAIASVASVATAAGAHAGGCYPGHYSGCAPAPAAPSTASSPASGSYECYAYSGGRLVPVGGLNFTITDSEDYTDVVGASGIYAFDVGSQDMLFGGGALDGQYAQYNGSRNPHTITFLDPQGELSDSCDLRR